MISETLKKTMIIAEITTTMISEMLRKISETLKTEIKMKDNN